MKHASLLAVAALSLLCATPPARACCSMYQLQVYCELGRSVCSYVMTNVCKPGYRYETCYCGIYGEWQYCYGSECNGMYMSAYGVGTCTAAPSADAAFPTVNVSLLFPNAWGGYSEAPAALSSSSSCAAPKAGGP